MSTSPKPAHNTPTSIKVGSASTSSGSAQTSAAIALNMSWQLLVVILVPIVGGHLLDVRFHTSPVFMTIGMAIGLVGTILVVRQTMKDLQTVMNQGSEGKK